MKYVLEVLFPYIVILYLLDCIIYIKKHHLLITSLFGKKFKIKKAGLYLAGLLPLSETILSHSLPICFTEDGIYIILEKSYSNSEVYKADDYKFIRFQNMNSVENEGKNVKLNTKHIIKTPSQLNARHLVDIINELKDLKLSKRIEKIGFFLSNSYDIQKITELKETYSNSFLPLKILGLYLFFLVFIMLPVVLYSNLYIYFNLYLLVICITATYFIILVMTFGTHKKVYKADKNLMAHTFLSIIFSPVNAIHVINYLTKDLFIRFNYLTIAASTISKNAFKAIVRNEIFLIDYYKNEINNQKWRKFWDLKKSALLELIEKSELSINEILKTPKKQDQTAILYCPACLTEYKKNRDECVDCRIVLNKF